MKVTKRQRACLTAIQEITEGLGYPPSLTEIAAHMNVSNRSTVHKHIENLAQMGLVTAEKGKRRTTALTDLGRSAIANLRSCQ